MAVWRWVVARASGFGEVSLSLLLPVVVAGLMFGATCGAPDEVMRGQAQLVGGDTGGSGGASSSSSRSGGNTGIAGSTAPTGGSVGPGGAGSSGSPGGASSAGGTSDSGGKTTAGGTTGGGGISNTGGKGSGGAGTGGRGGSGGAATGGKATGGVATGGTTASSTDGGGGSTFPFGGTTATGGAATGGVGSGGKNTGGVATGGTTRVSSGGAGGSSGGSSGSGGATSTAPPPTGLEVWVVGISGSTSQITFNIRIDNMASQSTDLSTVTLRYWYKDEGLGTALKVSAYYVSIGHSNTGSVVFDKIVAVSPAATGADHYFQLSFVGMLTAKNDSSGNDKFNIDVGLLNGGAFDVTNDYSYDGGATGAYENKITLYANGKLIWGVAP